MPDINMGLRFRRGTAAAWTAANTVLRDAEPGFETDTGKMKVGDGVTAWDALPYRFDAASSGVTEGEARAIAVEEVVREIYNPLTAINTGLNTGI